MIISKTYRYGIPLKILFYIIKHKFIKLNCIIIIYFIVQKKENHKI